MNVIDNTMLFLIQFLFDSYIFIVLLRITLQWVNADFTNPIFQLAIKLTNPPLKPIRHVIPTFHGIDIAAIVFLLLLEVIKLIIIVWLQIHTVPMISGLLVWSFAEILHQLLNIFFYSILALAILSWLSPLAHSPIIDALHRLSDPLMRPVRRILPPISGFDLSPIPVMLGLKLIEMLVVTPLAQIGAVLALGVVN